MPTFIRLSGWLPDLLSDPTPKGLQPSKITPCLERAKREINVAGGNMTLGRIWGISAPFLCLIATALVTRAVVFSGGLDVPISWQGDVLFVYLWAENLDRYGLTHAMPGLGYPFDASHLEFPIMPNYSYLGTLHLAALLTDNPVSSVNLASVLLVCINAGAAYLAVYIVTRKPGIALFAGIAFGLSFFSTTKLTDHLGVVSYSCVPLFFLAIYLVLNASKGNYLRALPSAALCATLAAFSNPYLTILSVLGFGGAGVVITLLSRQWTRTCLMLGAGALTMSVSLIAFSPAILYAMQHGVNPAVSLSSTSWQTVDLSGLRLSQMITFPAGHRFLDGGSLLTWLSEGRPATEAWGAYSLSYLLLGLAGTAYLWSEWPTSSAVVRASTVLSLTSIVFAFLFSAVGGLSDLLVFVVQQLRALSRGVVIIQFACLVLAALALNAWLDKLVMGKRFLPQRALQWVVGSAATAFVVTDQLPYDRSSQISAATLAYDADKTFFDQVAGKLGSFGEADLMQLPYQAFPEFGGPESMRPHDSLKPFLLIRNARTSAASFPGSNGAFHQMSMQDLFRSGQFSALQFEMDARGFEGLVIDRAGLSGYEQRRLQALIYQSTGAMTGGENDRFVFVQPVNWQNTADAIAPGGFLASYGPISLGLLGANARPVFEGGVRGFPRVTVSPSLALRVSRYADVAMQAVVQIEFTCGQAGSLNIRLDGISSSVILEPEPQILNFAVALPGSQNDIELVFLPEDPRITKSCTLSRPAVTFFQSL